MNDSRSIKRWCCLGAAVALAAGIWWTSTTRDGPTPSELMDSARAALADRRFDEAVRLASSVPSDTREWPAALALAARAVEKSGDAAAMAEFYLGLPDAGEGPIFEKLFFSAGDFLLEAGHLSAAERRFRSVLTINPGHGNARSRLAYTMVITGRRWEASGHLFELVRQRQWSQFDLFYLSDKDRPVEALTYFDVCREAAPDDPLPLLGKATVAMANNRLAEAQALIRQYLAQRPDDLEGLARQGRLLVLTQAFDEIPVWNRTLPDNASGHPSIWLARAEYCSHNGRQRDAVRCFGEALRLDSTSIVANHRMGRELVRLGNPEQAEPFLSRANALQESAVLLSGFRGDDYDLEIMERTARQFEKLGRMWEAWAWALTATRSDPQLVRARDVVDRIEPMLQDDVPRTLDSFDTVNSIVMGDYPLPGWIEADGPLEQAATATVGTASGHDAGPSETVPYRFVDQANSAGIHFTYINRPDANGPGRLFFQTTGGGVGVIDYDSDGWPDLYFTQGCRWPVDAASGEFVNALYRNLGNGRFVDVTDCLLPAGNGFGQGVAVGDFDSDGFADLYVANFGRNRLYRNNGDGSLSDVTETAGVAAEQWTTSCMMADLNSDGLPELYDVNYVGGEALGTLLCGTEPNLHSCGPIKFHAEQDRLLLNSGDGEFHDVTDGSGIVIPHGKGLGILAADFDGSGRLDVFVANDTCANAFFRNDTASPGRSPRFSDQAVVNGLAFDAQGHAQGSMGVALADINHDSAFDMFVANYYQESNTFYIGTAEGLYTDETARTGIRSPSFGLVSWGAQFLDADLDGVSELVVSNGDIDEFVDEQRPFQMPPHFLRNSGNSRFELVEGEQLGDYFQGAYAGRGLARLDWNRDGRVDFVVSHIESEAALVTNQTTPHGHHLSLCLHGTTSNRDAIGTVVTATLADRTVTGHVTAGDGYHASNQRQIVIGLGDQDRVAKLTVRWPSGLTQTFDDVASDRELLLIEGRDDFYDLTPDR